MLKLTLKGNRQEVSSFFETFQADPQHDIQLSIVEYDPTQDELHLTIYFHFDLEAATWRER